MFSINSIIRALEQAVYYPSKFDFDPERKEAVIREDYAELREIRKKYTDFKMDPDQDPDNFISIPKKSIEIFFTNLPSSSSQPAKEIEEKVNEKESNQSVPTATEPSNEDQSSIVPASLTRVERQAKVVIEICEQVLKSNVSDVHQLFHLKSLLAFYDLILLDKNQSLVSTETKGKYFIDLTKMIDEKVRSLLKNSPLTVLFAQLQRYSSQKSLNQEEKKSICLSMNMLYYEKILSDLYASTNRYAICKFIYDQHLVNPVEGNNMLKEGVNGLQDVKIIFDSDFGVGLLLCSGAEGKQDGDSSSSLHLVLRFDRLSQGEREYLYNKLYQIHETGNPLESKASRGLLKMLEGLHFKDKYSQFQENERKIQGVWDEIGQTEILGNVFNKTLSFASSLFTLEQIFPLTEARMDKQIKVDRNSNYEASFYTKAESYLEFYRSTSDTKQKMYRVAHGILFADKKKIDTGMGQFENDIFKRIAFKEKQVFLPHPDKLFGIEPKKEEVTKPILFSSKSVETSAPSATEALSDLKSTPISETPEKQSIKSKESASKEVLSSELPKREHDFTYSSRVIAQYENDKVNSLVSHAVPFSVDPYVFTYGIETARKNQTHPKYMDRHWTVPVEIIQNGSSERYKMTIALSGKDNMVYHRCLEKKTTQDFLTGFFKEGDDLAEFPPLTSETQQQKLSRPIRQDSTVIKPCNFFTVEIVDPDFGTVRIFDYKKLKEITQRS